MSIFDKNMVNKYAHLFGEVYDAEIEFKLNLLNYLKKFTDFECGENNELLQSIFTSLQTVIFNGRIVVNTKNPSYNFGITLTNNHIHEVSVNEYGLAWYTS